MSEEIVRLVEIGIAGVVVTMATFLLGMFRAELLGIVFSLTTLAGQFVVTFLDLVDSAVIDSGHTDPL